VEILWIITIVSVLAIVLVYVTSITNQTNFSNFLGKITGDVIAKAADSCTDTDGGKNFDVLGATVLTSGGVTKAKQDSCLPYINSKILQETYCYKPPFSKKILIGALNYKCPYSCSNGACVKQNPNPNPTPSGKTEYVISGASVSSAYTPTGTTTIKLKVKDKLGVGSNGKIFVYDPSYRFSTEKIPVTLSGSTETEAIFTITGNPCPGMAFNMLLNDTQTLNKEIDYAELYDRFTISIFCALNSQSQSRCSSIKIQGEYSQFPTINQDHC